MRAIFRPSVFLLGLLLAAGIARAEKSILIVKVMDLKNNPVRGVRLALEEPGCVALGPSDDRGVLRIKLAPGIDPQSWVTLELTSARYALLQPYDRRAQVPAFENEAVNYLRVFLMSKGDRAALDSGKFAVQMAVQFNSKLMPRPKAETESGAITEEQRKTVLVELANSVGLKPDEIDHAIRAYGGKTADPYEVGVIALYERNYAKATAELTRSYEMREQALDKAQEEMVTVALSLGQSLYGQGNYREAVVKFQKANALKPDNSIILSWLGLSLHNAGQYTKAEPLYKRALDIHEKALGKDHPSTATSLNNLAELYRAQGKYAEAEPLYKRALDIREKTLGKDHPLTAPSHNNLAELYRAQGKYAEAEPLYKRALDIHEKALGKDHPLTAASLNNLAGLYESQGKYAEAEPLYKRALDIREKAEYKDYRSTAASLNNLAELYRAQGKYAEAEPLHKRALDIHEKALGKNHPSTATSLNNLAVLYKSQGKYAEAEPLYKRALDIREKTLGKDHPLTAASLNNLAGLYESQGNYAEAEPLYKWALVIFEAALGPEHPKVAMALESYAVLLRKMNRADEAAKLEARAKEIRAKAK